MTVGLLALIVAALFTGAAFYVSFVEHPARVQLDARAQLVQWKPAYARGTAMQAPLGMLGFLLGATAWWLTGDWRWLAGALVLLAAWPYTLIVIMPTNRRLQAITPEQAGPQSHALLERWGRLHAVRTALGIGSTAIFFWASAFWSKIG